MVLLALRLALVAAPVVGCSARGVAELAAGSPVTAPRPLGSPPCCAWTDPAMVNGRLSGPVLKGDGRRARRTVKARPRPSEKSLEPDGTDCIHRRWFGRAEQAGSIFS